MAYRRENGPSSPRSGEQRASPFAPRPFAAPRRPAAAPGLLPHQSGLGPSHSDEETDEEELLQRKFDAGARERVPLEGLVQRYKIEREPTTQEVYSRSDDDKLVTGMSTPNHELFVDNATRIGRMNTAFSASPLEFFSAGSRKLFGEDYQQIGLRFRSEAPEKKEASLQETYSGSVAPRIETFRQGLLDQKTAEITGAAKDSKGEIKPGAINDPLRTAVRKLNLFKKLVLAELSRPDAKGGHAGPIATAQEIVSALEEALYSPAMRQAGMSLAVEKVGHYFDEEIDLGELPRTPIVRQTMAELWDAVLRLWKALPADAEVDLVSFHSANFQAAQLETVRNGGVLLYRACDVTASTLLGNKITRGNEDRLKVYAAGGNTRAFHYATKILESGRDWVTLEGFAAGDLERQIIGIDETSSTKNIDNTWQYMMYGSIADKEDKSISDEDRSFELYTKLRYYLKGIKEPGRFSLKQREKLVGRPVTGAVLQPLFPAARGFGSGLVNLVSESPEKKAQALLEDLKTAKILDAEGRVTDPEGLTPERIGAALPAKLRDKAPAVTRILRSLTPTHIQMGLSSDMANVAAWRAYLGESPEVLQSLQMEMMDQLAEQGRDPRELSQTAWAALPAEIAQLQKRSRISAPPSTGASSVSISSSSASSSSAPASSLSTPSSSEAKTPAPTDSKTTMTTSSSSAAPARQPPATRYGLIARARADLNALRDAWQGADAKQRTASPPGYLEYVQALDSIAEAPLHAPIEELCDRVDKLLAHARRQWSAS